MKNTHTKKGGVGGRGCRFWKLCTELDLFCAAVLSFKKCKYCSDVATPLLPVRPPLESASSPSVTCNRLAVKQVLECLFVAWLGSAHNPSHTEYCIGGIAVTKNIDCIGTEDNEYGVRETNCRRLTRPHCLCTSYFKMHGWRL